MTQTEIARLGIFVVGYLFIFFSLIPLVRSDYWLIRIFDYPRSQKFWVTLLVLLTFLPFSDFAATHDWVFICLLVVNIIYLLTLIWSYTPLAQVQMKQNTSKASGNIRILIANVFQDNQDTHLCNEIIGKHTPDIVLLVETDNRWQTEVEKALGDYPYRILKPQSNTYGMILYSKLEIVKHEIRFLVENDIPSITADVKAPDGALFRLYCLHPRPPVPGESDDSTERDAEILIIGKEAKKATLPVIVAGDLNDVAWSYTTNLFLKISELLDPRIGRGFFSTFHAKYKLFRWPLDHVFCSSHFCLNQLKRLPSIGSDHFPILIDVSLMPHEVPENEEEKKEADSEEVELADAKIEAAR